MKSKYVLAATLVLSGFATEAAMAQQRVKKPITNKHPSTIARNAVIQSAPTWGLGTCTGTLPSQGDTRANPPFGRSGLPYCGGNPANQN